MIDASRNAGIVLIDCLKLQALGRRVNYAKFGLQRPLVKRRPWKGQSQIENTSNGT